MAEAQLRATSLLTQKDKSKLNYNGYRYTVDRVKDATTYWRCEDRKCRGRVIQRGDTYEETKVHNHAPDPAMSRVLNDEPKSTNGLEAWHRRFGCIIGKSHPNVYEFIAKLKEEQSYTEYRIDKIFAGEDPVKINRKDKQIANRLKRIVSEFHQNPSVIEYLRGCGHNFNFQI